MKNESVTNITVEPFNGIKPADIKSKLSSIYKEAVNSGEQDDNVQEDDYINIDNGDGC